MVGVRGLMAQVQDQNSLGGPQPWLDDFRKRLSAEVGLFLENSWKAITFLLAE